MIGIDTSKENDEKAEVCSLDMLVYKEVARRRQKLKNKPAVKTTKTGEADSPEKYRRKLKFNKKSKEGKWI